MFVVIETGVIAEQYFFYRMALAAILDAEGGFTVMAGAAGFAFFHIGHGIASGRTSG